MLRYPVSFSLFVRADCHASAETPVKKVEQAFKDFCQREDIGIILISQNVRTSVLFCSLNCVIGWLHLMVVKSVKNETDALEQRMSQQRVTSEIQVSRGL